MINRSVWMLCLSLCLLPLPLPLPPLLLLLLLLLLLRPTAVSMQAWCRALTVRSQTTQMHSASSLCKGATPPPFSRRFYRQRTAQQQARLT